MKIQVHRLSASPYLDATFFLKEKEAIESVPGVTYISNISEISKDIPFILLTNTHTKLNDIPKQILDKTLCMIHPNSGYDNFNASFADEVKFPIILGNPIRSHPVSEYILGCLFKHFVNIPSQLHWSETRKWNRALIRDQKILIIGQGTIGKILAQTLTPLCPSVSFFDPYKDEQFLKTNKAKKIDPALISKQDVIIFAQSLNEENKNSFGREFFDSLKTTSLIINAARGGFLIEEELSRYLKNNANAYAYLDVFQEEPYTPGYFSELPNINKTSHIAGVHESLNNDIIKFEYHIIKNFMDYFLENQLENFEKDYFDISLKSKIKENMLL